MSDYNNNNINGFSDELNNLSSYDSVNSEQTESDTPNQYSENSYEWNSDKTERATGSEYHYSYVNGNNQNAPHNPNNFDSAYHKGAQQTA